MQMNSEQESIASTISDLLDTTSPPSRLRTLTPDETAFDPDLWKLAAAQGWFGIDVPEAHGGAGFGLPEQLLLFRELGRHLTAGPYLGTAITGQVLAAAGNLELLNKLVVGDLRVGLCEPLRSGDPEQDPSVGPRMLTNDADEVDAFVCVSQESTSAVFLVDDVSVTRRRSSIDNGSRWAELQAHREPIVTLAKKQFDALTYGHLLVAAMLAGIAAETASQSSAYAKVREQFGVPIGVFQAVQHRCAEQAIRGDAALQLVTLAGLTVAADGTNAQLLAASAGLVAANYALANCADNIQNLGGIGYTDEHDAHLFLKRTHVLALTLGDFQDRREAMLRAPLRRT